MLDRAALHKRILTELRDERAIALTGARQVGKTALALDITRQQGGIYLDLEAPDILAGLNDPLRVLGAMTEQGRQVVLDEVQRRPDLFAGLRVLIDRNVRKGQFLLPGSASPASLRQSSESLAGRVNLIEMAEVAGQLYGAGVQQRRAGARHWPV